MTDETESGVHLPDKVDRDKLDKMSALRAAGLDPYSEVKYERTHSAAEITGAFDELEGETVRVAGRIMKKRVMGKAGFADLHDQSGKVQLYFKRDALKYEWGNPDARPDDVPAGEPARDFTAYALYKRLDLGDVIGAEGTVFKTKTGETTVEVETFTLLSKTLRTLPEKWHGLRDVESRYRNRHVDLIVNKDVRDRFVLISRFRSEIRRYLEERDFIEVETPILQEIAGGGTAEPFETHFRALHQDMFLRIAIELHLKRLIVGGLERVYEMGRIFRNEGTSTHHNPEFTMLELYWAYADYGDIMTLTEGLIGRLCTCIFGTFDFKFGGYEINFEPPFRRITFWEAMERYAGTRMDEVGTLSEVVSKAKTLGIELPKTRTYEKVLDEIFKELVEPNLIEPTFVLDFPVELTLLAKRKPDDPRTVYRFELFAAGFEIANSFSEANDPIDQRARMEEQVREAIESGDHSRVVDEDFLAALEHGMPPNGGIGMGIDRLAMLLTGMTSIREVLLFPQLRSLKGRGEERENET